jgi:tetratricopeptide (TPR) repeat protein
MRSKGVVLLALLALAGCKSIRSVRVESPRPLALTPAEAERMRAEGMRLFDEQPRTVERVRRAARQLEDAARTLRDDYDAQWPAAQALAFCAEHETQSQLRKDAAQRGIVLARRGRELNPGRVECHYWYAMNVGLLAEVDRSFGLDAVGEMERALKQAGEIDERYDYAGPLRVLGILHLRAPAPPTSIGSPRRGLRLLQRATELFPDYPENFLYLAEALRDADRPVEARAALSKVIEAPPWPDRQFESELWKADARKLLNSLPGP